MLLSLSFLWVFVTKKEIWWVVAPGVGALAFAVAIIVSSLIPPNNGWAGMLILGAAGLVIAAIASVNGRMKTGYVVGTLTWSSGFPWRLSRAHGR